MTIVIPWIGPDSTELRYTLRSIDKHLPDVEGVTVIGYSMPLWLRNVTHIQHRDHPAPHMAHRNVWDKLQIVPDAKFLFVADDHYLLRDYVAADFPNYYTGTLDEAHAKTRFGNPYHATLQNTIDVLGAKAKAYNTHCPFVIEKKKLAKLAKYDWYKPHGYCLKTIYCKGGEQAVDLKLRADRNPDLTGRDWFSTSPTFISRGGERLLKKLFPNKSRYEV